MEKVSVARLRFERDCVAVKCDVYHKAERTCPTRATNPFDARTCTSRSSAFLMLLVRLAPTNFILLNATIAGCASVMW